MNIILADLTWKIYILYLNNVIIYGKIFEKEIINLKNILPTWSMSTYKIIKNASLQKK